MKKEQSRTAYQDSDLPESIHLATARLQLILLSTNFILILLNMLSRPFVFGTFGIHPISDGMIDQPIFSDLMTFASLIALQLLTVFLSWISLSLDFIIFDIICSFALTSTVGFILIVSGFRSIVGSLDLAHVTFLFLFLWFFNLAVLAYPRMVYHRLIRNNIFYGIE